MIKKKLLLLGATWYVWLQKSNTCHFDRCNLYFLFLFLFYYCF